MIKEKCPNCEGKLVLTIGREGNVYVCFSCGHLYHGKLDLYNAIQEKKWRKSLYNIKQEKKWRKYANL